MDGVSERQCERFGQQLVNCVANFCKENKLEPGKFNDHTDSGSPTSAQVFKLHFSLLCDFLRLFTSRFLRAATYITGHQGLF